jgi:hypothetical protein
MIKLVSTSLVAAALGLGLTLAAGSASAGEPCTKDCEPPPKVTADCSPGYYKNHPEEWCNGYIGDGSPSDPDYPGSELSKACASGLGCTVLLRQLKNHTPVVGADIREGAKLYLDTCFGTAELSPCEDDD